MICGSAGGYFCPGQAAILNVGSTIEKKRAALEKSDGKISGQSKGKQGDV